MYKDYVSILILQVPLFFTETGSSCIQCGDYNEYNYLFSFY